MSLSGALSSAISALKAQSTAIAVVSDNIANSGTYGYKTTSSLFSSLVTGSSSSSYSPGGVTVYAKSNISEQGLLTATSTATNVAIDGNGFFVVASGVGEAGHYYTRNGAFELDDGYLVRNGYYLQGWRTDADGNVVVSEDASNLDTINTNIVSSTAEATTETAFGLNLPAEAASGATFTTSMQLYDSLGTSSSITVTWTKGTTANSWTASFSNPTLSSDSSTSTGTVTGSVTLTFNDDGSLASTLPSPPSIAVDWTTGAADSTIALDLGTVGGIDGVTQYNSGLDTPSIDLDSIESDGLAYGTMSSVAVGEDGVVEATFSNGKTIAIYKVAVATFTNANGLSAESGGIYQETASSGSASLHESGEGGAGTVYGSEIEESKTDTSSEFSNLIQAQQAYSAAAQVVTAVDEMYDTLISAMR